MKTIKEYISENKQYHWWANPQMNANELKEFDKMKDFDFNKISLGLEIIAKNHNSELEVVTDYIESDGQVLFKFSKNNVPTYSDVETFIDEFDAQEVLEIDDRASELYVTYYIPTEEEYKELCKMK